MSRLDWYHRSPVPLQHAIATAYGAREQVRRYRGAYRPMVAALEAHQTWTPEQLAGHQLDTLRSWLQQRATDVPHIRDALGAAGLAPADLRSIDDLADLPLIDKEQVRAEPDRHRSTSAATVWRQTTGGTTGAPLETWATPAAVQRNYAFYEARARRGLGIRGRVRTASLQGQVIVPPDQLGPPYWRRNLAADQLYLSSHHLRDATVATYVEAIAGFAPALISGYPSAVHRVARHLLEIGDHDRITPHAVLLAGEQLRPEVAREISTAFGGARVGQAYGMSELLVFASSCEEGHLHVSPEYGVLEVVDGAIVGTSLINDGTPLLRYRTGDRAERLVPGPASCGRPFPVLEGLAGRVDDLVHTPEGAALGPALLSLAFQAVPGLRRGQILQHRRDAITVLVEVQPSWSTADADRLRSELRRRVGPSLGLSIEVVDAVERTSGGKERMILSSIAP